MEVLGAGEINKFKTEGLENADATDLGEIVSSRQSTSLSAFRFRSGDAKTTRSLTVNVARYTPQAVLMANVAEARYNVLITNEGKQLVQARYAVRNNQRNFLKITLPQGATLWSASFAGKPIRPGQSPDGSVLLPLEKAHAGEDSPEFAVELVYISKGTAWNDKGQFKLALPALDLPVSRTGLARLSSAALQSIARAGILPHRSVCGAALRSSEFSTTASSATANGHRCSGNGPWGQRFTSVNEFKVEGRCRDGCESALPQTLVDNFRMALQGGKASGILPIKVSFAALGPSLYLVSELTGENQSPSTDLDYQREKKAGGR